MHTVRMMYPIPECTIIGATTPDLGTKFLRSAKIKFMAVNAGPYGLEISKRYSFYSFRPTWAKLY